MGTAALPRPALAPRTKGFREVPDRPETAAHESTFHCEDQDE